MHALTMGPALLRPFFAFTLLAGFLARSTGVERLHQCPTGSVAHGARHGEHEHGHRTLPPGADRCECVGQSCTTSVAVPVARQTLIGASAAFPAAVPPAETVVARPAVPHLLPFADGPPA
jgi:hypothetical protein